MHATWHAAMIASATLLLTTMAHADLMLIRHQQSRAAIVLAEDAAEDEKLAAEELQTYLQRIGGVRLPIHTGRAPDHAQPLIRIGMAADEVRLAPLRERTSDPAAFVLAVTDRGVDLRGLSPEGTLFAAYELLEQLGVRWYMPGELGQVVPRLAEVRLPLQVTMQTPSFTARHLQTVMAQVRGYDPHWYRRARLGGPFYQGAHEFPGLSRNAAALFESHPELFSLIDGKRVLQQYCVSNPQVLDRVAEAARAHFRRNPDSPWLGIGPRDGEGHCECDGCTTLDAGDWDPFSHTVSKTDRYIWFFNRVLKEIEDEFPDKTLAFYIYSSYTRPPVREKPDLRLVPAHAPITLCRIHGMDNPVCPERQYYGELMRQWGALLPNIYERGYYFNLACPGLPFSKVHALRVETPAALEHGVVGWRVETMPHWVSMTPTIYVATRLFWDAHADVDALLVDFAERFFGPAGEPMHAYLVAMDAALRDGDHHTGSSFDMPHLYPAELRGAMRALLDQAAARVPSDSVEAERVALFRHSFDYLEAFIEMLTSRVEHDYAASHAALMKVDALREHLLTGYDIPMLYPSVAARYLERFFRRATEQAYARTTEGNRFVAGLDDQWQFLIDPAGLGEALGYHRRELAGGNWQPIRTASQSWSQQGLRYYKGEAWYRQTIHIPAQFAGQRIFFWFGGVDEQAKVWVNGQLVGISHTASFIPFELDATEAVRPGAANVVAVRIINQRLDELGTGGILAPVMFYAPAAGADAQLDNLRQLPQVFPLY